MHLKEIFISLLLVADVALPYITEMQEVVEGAKERIEELAPYQERTVVIIDIDETALSNGDFFLVHEGSDHCAAWEAFYNTHPARANGPILHLTEWLQERGIQVIFLTGRSEKLRELTERQLHEAGYRDWHSLYLRPELESSVPFKHRTLKEIAERGYFVLAHFSDREDDLEGEIALFNFLVPNPFY